MAKRKENRKPDEAKLPDSELEVMRILWRIQRATARDIWSELRSGGSKWAYATVNTLLLRLETKGLATSDKSQMTYIYSPMISRQQVVQKRVRHLVDKLYDGKGGMLVMSACGSMPTVRPSEIRL